MGAVCSCGFGRRYLPPGITYLQYNELVDVRNPTDTVKFIGSCWALMTVPVVIRSAWPGSGWASRSVWSLVFVKSSDSQRSWRRPYSRRSFSRSLNSFSYRYIHCALPVATIGLQCFTKTSKVSFGWWMTCSARLGLGRLMILMPL